MKPVSSSEPVEPAATPAALRLPGGATSAATPGLQPLKPRTAALAHNSEPECSRDDSFLSADEVHKTLSDLRVDQIKLETQNEALRRAQFELDRQRERYFDLYDLAPVGYCTVSANGLILEANLTVASLLGVTRSALVKQALSCFVEKTDQDCYYLHCNQLLQTRRAQSCELQMLSSTSGTFWAKMTATVADSDGVDVMRIVLSDITQAKLADAARQTALDLMHNIASRVPGVVYQYLLRADGSSCFPFASDAMRDIYRVSPEDVREDASKVFAVLHPDDLVAVVASIQASARDLTPWLHEYRVRFDDGTINWLLGNAVPQRESDGAVLWHGFISNINERKHAELVLKQSEQRLRIREKQMVIAQKISGTGSWTYNLATNEVWGSAAGMGIFGYPPVAGSLPLDRFEACLAEKDRARVRQSLTDLIQKGTEYDLEFAVKPADGSPERLTHSVGTLETDDQGNPLTVMGFVQDITKARLLEEKVRQLAFCDPLTALPNRRLLFDRLDQAVQAAQRSSCYGTLMFLDLDNFKPLNDQYGHAAGDLLLIEVARRLHSCVRGVDTVARIGGDEFVVLMVGLTSHQAASVEQSKKLAEKIRAALAKPYLLSSPNAHETLEHHCSASIGVVLFGKQHQSIEGLLKWADAAMYRSKEDGRNRVTFMIERRIQQRSQASL